MTLMNQRIDSLRVLISFDQLFELESHPPRHHVMCLAACASGALEVSMDIIMNQHGKKKVIALEAGLYNSE